MIFTASTFFGGFFLGVYLSPWLEAQWDKVKDWVYGDDDDMRDTHLQ